jgi:hypothetical protein
MTAIALLNAANDPHLVADTLLSAEGPDPRAKKRIWLPALGSVKSEWATDDGKWHISRLGRKTFALPNRCGVLSFSGDCGAAFRFWDKLSETWHQVSGYDPLARIDRSTLDRILHRMPETAMRFCLLGVLIDSAGQREAFVHNNHQCFETEQFGTCYVAGSGEGLVREIVERLDRHLTQAGGWPSSYPISATEDLAEHISAEMLHRESFASNGVDPGTPLTLRCGGYYEWYKVERDGLRPMRPRIDLHMTVGREGLVVTRAYFVEQEQVPTHEASTSQKIFTAVTTLGLVPFEIPLCRPSAHGFTVALDEVWGVLIPTTFLPYDVPSGEESLETMSGQLTPPLLAHKFPSTHDVKRIRVIVGGPSHGGLMKRFMASRDGAGDATLSVADGKLSLWLSQRLLADTFVSVLSMLEKAT